MSVLLFAFYAGCDGDVIRFTEACDYCADDESCCNDVCVKFDSHKSHCGKCDNACGLSESCVQGKCSLAEDACGGCADGLECCGVSCTDLNQNDQNCGLCGNDCPTGMTCRDGRCADPDVSKCDEDCVSPRTCCDDACVNTDADADNCGSCGKKCLQNELCVKGKCIDPDNPGSCEDGCVNGSCCEDKCVDLNSDNQNCGACGIVCDNGLFCSNAHCQAACLCDEGLICNAQGKCVEKCGEQACADDEICCNDKCVDPKSSENCGSCDNACSGDTPICFDGKCSKDCGSLELCGSACADLQSDDAHCGKCTTACSKSQKCVNGSCECNPKTCSELGKTCGKADDGCGNELDCGSCAEGQTCNNGVCGCKVKSCADLGYSCGEIDDGCGKKLNCGSCTSPKTCSNGVCGCKPKTCSELGKNCGEIDDGCGGKLNCGSCSSGQTCTENVCNCQKTTCSAAGKNCGEISDGCGGKLNCGSCSSPKTCQSNVCKCTPTTCSAAGKNCGEIDDKCGGKLNCGSCASGQTCTNNVCKSNSIKDTYPTRKSIKGLQPDFMNMDEIIGNAVHGIAMNMVWMEWQPSKSTSCSGGQVAYDGYCYNVNGTIANAIKKYTDAGVVVTAVVYGVPGWCRRSCSGVVADFFCAPTSEGASHYGRFVGFLANYFNGENGHGRIADFVIHNEVNATEWFNYGCSAGTCNVDTWSSIYAESWNAAYDYARKEQKNAKVLISLEHNWDVSYLNNARPVVAGETFLKNLIPKLGAIRPICLIRLSVLTIFQTVIPLLSAISVYSPDGFARIIPTIRTHGKFSSRKMASMATVHQCSPGRIHSSVRHFAIFWERRVSKVSFITASRIIPMKDHSSSVFGLDRRAMVIPVPQSLHGRRLLWQIEPE